MSMEEVSDFLEHYGKKGMKWGVRKAERGGVSRRTDREARKDAEEFARAKMFYGQGAGTRRKLIKNSVEAKKARDPDYAKAFDRNLASQDMSKQASGARRERKRKDRGDRTKKQAGYIARKFTGEMGTQAAFTAVVIGGAAYLKSPQGQRMINKATSAVRNSNAQRAGADYLSDYFSRNT